MYIPILSCLYSDLLALVFPHSWRRVMELQLPGLYVMTLKQPEKGSHCLLVCQHQLAFISS